MPPKHEPHIQDEKLEEAIRARLDERAHEMFGVNYSELPPEEQAMLRDELIQKAYQQDSAPEVTPEFTEDE